GDKVQNNLRANGYNLLPAICYEIVFADLVRGNYKSDSDLLFTVSNDAWFGDSIGPLQHMQIARMRALELQRPLVRVTNNGVSAVYD
ncbi:nitrilase-related carbon-nitrogen hydrolase, partial [Psychrobacter sp. CAL495-MNA-CIBAN-0180]